MCHKQRIIKNIAIEGMECASCQKRIEEALISLPDVKEVRVDLEKKSAIVIVNGRVQDILLKETITDLGYEVTSIQVQE